LGADYVVDSPKQPVTKFWQRVQRLVVYRTDGTSVTSII
jgi:hypothetical protein